jgi:VanZ family protein
LPGATFPKKDWLDSIWFDKWVHIAMFAIMVVLWCRGLSVHKGGQVKTKRLFIIAASLCLAYGAGMEFVQEYFVSRRSFDYGDIIADGVGSVSGLVWSVMRYIKK